MLRLDRLRALAEVYPGVDREDEMVAAFDYCLHGRGGAAPSIDTAMHGLVEAAHVDHLHPDSGIALATAVDGERLTAECFGDRVVWIPWRRPGLPAGPRGRRRPAGQPAGHRRHPRRPRHHRLGRHQRGRARPARSRSSARPRRSSPPAASPSPSGRSWRGSRRSPTVERRARAAALAPVIRGLASTDRPQVGPLRPTRTPCWTSAPGRSWPGWPGWGRRVRITSCARRSARSCWTSRRPLRSRRPWPACGTCTPRTGRTTAPTTSATPKRTRRPFAGRIRPSCWCPASACSPSGRRSRRPGWRASSTSTPST